MQASSDSWEIYLLTEMIKWTTDGEHQSCNICWVCSEINMNTQVCRTIFFLWHSQGRPADATQSAEQAWATAIPN